MGVYLANAKSGGYFFSIKWSEVLLNIGTYKQVTTIFPWMNPQYPKQHSPHCHLSATFSVVLTLSHRAKTVCSKPELLQQEKDHLRKALTKCKYPKWALDKVEKRLNKSTMRSLMGLITKALHVPKLSLAKFKLRATLSYPTHKVFVKVSKRSVVDMAFKPTLKVAVPSKTSWSPPRQRPYGQPKWCHILVPMW